MSDPARPRAEALLEKLACWPEGVLKAEAAEMVRALLAENERLTEKVEQLKAEISVGPVLQKHAVLHWRERAEAAEQQVAALREALDAIASPGCVSDYGWWTETARKALASAGRGEQEN